MLITQILICMIWMVPESHIHYARKGDHENAKKSMLRLYGTAPDYDVVSQPFRWIDSSDDAQEYEYRVVQHGIEAERAFSAASEGASYADIFRGLNWKRTLAGCMGILSQPFAGAPIVFGYSTVSRACRSRALADKASTSSKSLAWPILSSSRSSRAPSSFAFSNT